MHDFIPHTELRDGMNTDDLCEVWFSFITYHGLEQESDQCDNDAAKLLEYFKMWQDAYTVAAWPDPLVAWLNDYVAAWCRACDAEWRIGHGIEPHHGWTQPTK